MQPVELNLQKLAKLVSAGRFEEAIRAGTLMLRTNHTSVPVLNLVGVAALKANRIETSVQAFRRATKLEPNSVPLKVNLALALMAGEETDQAVAVLKKATRKFPGNAVLYHKLGIAYRKKANAALAEENFLRALECDPSFLDAQFSLGSIQLSKGEAQAAIESYQRVLEMKPNLAEAHYALGTAFQLADQPKSAIRHYQQALEIEPNHADALQNLGTASYNQGDIGLAETLFSRALQINKEDVKALCGLGLVALKKKNKTLANQLFQSAVRMAPSFADAQRGLAETYSEIGDLDLALKHIEKALMLKSDDNQFVSDKVSILLKTADWKALATLMDDTQQLQEQMDHLPLLTAMYLKDDPELQLRLARQASDKVFPANAAPEFQAATNRLNDLQTLRIGYVSANFNKHPVMDLTKGLFREHDTSKFEIHVISCSHQLHEETVDELKAQGHKIHHVGELSNQDFVQYVRGLDLDIAIDMTGHTANTRTELFGYRLAPIQANFLAFPGTIGSESIDYIIADETVIEPDQAHNYVEKILWLPDSFMPSDNQRAISEKPQERPVYGLPEEGFVFCSFNNPMKISAQEFSIWMRLLNGVDDSCLWLTGSNKWATENLRRQAEASDVDPDRLVFTERVPKDEHLARHRHADLFLDTFNYNAHTTANEALWSGLPVVTKIGGQFAARVAASVLRAVGLPELVTQSEAEYEALALALARDPKRLSALREKLHANRQSTALFDTKSYARNFEAGLAEAHRRQIAGEPVSNILITNSKPA